VISSNRAGRVIVIIAQVAPNHYSATKALSQMNHAEYQYDLMGRLLITTEKYQDPDTNGWRSVVVRALTYDAKGRLVLEKDALGYSGNYGTSYEYDPEDRVIKMKDPVTAQKGLNHTQLNQYDGLGRLTKSTDAKGVETLQTFNAQDKLLTKTVGGVLIQTNTYDIAGNLLTKKMQTTTPPATCIMRSTKSARRPCPATAPSAVTPSLTSTVKWA
jgi:YD repeat-containing protein